MTIQIRAKEMVLWTVAGVGFFVFGMGPISVAQKADDNAKVAKPHQNEEKDPIPAKLLKAKEEHVKETDEARKKFLETLDEKKECSTGVALTKVTINDRKDGSGLRYLSQGAVYLADRDYLVVTYPRELAGSTMVVRPADRHGDWLQALKVSVSRDCTIYAAIRWE